ncbi:MAG: hypothetical protein FD177_374 [Desulfovibrionaceae bacterium]|nr:MAG: hypothetical protein FD177_374 [Desulfovibrionaceae bacterium]
MPSYLSAFFTSEWRGRFCLWAILGVAVALRLWRLDVPSLWFDEILVAMVAKLPVMTIIQRSLTEDFHPPVFYLITKAVGGVGISDAVLRLPLVMFGVAGVWLSWRAGRELLSERAGLLLAAMVAIQPWHLLLSRQLRPYAIIFFFSLMGFVFLYRAFQFGRRRDFVLGAFSLWVPLLLHFSGILVMGGAGLLTLCAWSSGRVTRTNVGWFSLACLGGVVLVLPFLWMLFTRESTMTGVHGYATVSRVCLDNFMGLLTRDNSPYVRMGLAALSLLGLAGLLRSNRLLALMSLGWFVFPLTTLVAARYSTYFNPWHLMFLLPVLLLWQIHGITMVVGDRALPWCALALAGAGFGLYVTAGEKHYYSQDSHNGEYRQQAQSLLGNRFSSTVYVYPENGILSPLNWYLDQFAQPNPVRALRLGPQDVTARIAVPGTGQPERSIVRTPVISMESLPYRYRVTSRPDDLLAQVNRLEYLACKPVLEEILIATQAGQTGFAEFVFEAGPALRAAPQKLVIVHFGYSNRLPGNRFAVSCRFDGEPWAAAFESLGADMRGHDKLELRRAEPFERLTVRLELLRDGRSPAFTGEDLEAVRFLDFKLEVRAENN